MSSSAVAIDPKRMAAQRVRERFFHGMTLAAAVLVLALLGGVVIALLHGAWPAFARFKLAFLTREIWDPVADNYGALGAVYGTVVTSIIAMLLALPISFGIAVFLTELAPSWLKRRSTALTRPL